MSNGYSWKLIRDILLIVDGTIKNYVDAYQKGRLEELGEKIIE